MPIATPREASISTGGAFDALSSLSSRRPGGSIAMISHGNDRGVIVVRPVIRAPKTVRAKAATEADCKMRAGFRATATVVTDAVCPEAEWNVATLQPARERVVFRSSRGGQRGWRAGDLGHEQQGKGKRKGKRQGTLGGMAILSCLKCH
jgi:hypothetical protein